MVSRVDQDGVPQGLEMPYPDGVKVRTDDKKFWWEQKAKGLFGQDVFPPGSSPKIAITEGEYDAASVFQAFGIPAVSVHNASAALQNCRDNWDYLNSFDTIYLALDDDAPGRKATAEIARLFDPNKVYDVKFGKLKDANQYLQDGRQEDLRRLFLNAGRWTPEGIISSLLEFEAIIDDDEAKPGVPYPFPSVQEFTFGIRTGEVVLITAMEGVGKTEIVRAIEYNLLRSTTSNIGIIHLEEGKSRNLKGLAGLHLGTAAHLPTSKVTKEDIKRAVADLHSNGRIHIYNHFGSDDPDAILDIIRYLVAVCGCKYVTLDHITMVVSGLNDDDERRTLDYLSTKLATMVEELDFALILVSHINDNGKTRGSRNISKIADVWISLDRDLTAASEEERNTTKVTINKNRFGARTGPARSLTFDVETFRVTEKESGSFDLPPLKRNDF